MASLSSNQNNIDDNPVAKSVLKLRPNHVEQSDLGAWTTLAATPKANLRDAICKRNQSHVTRMNRQSA
jgi:hypothetical protein